MLLESRVAHPTTESEAARLASELYALECTAEALPGEYDDNFHLVTADDRHFVLKVMHPAHESSFVDMQARALQHLAKKLPDRELPRVIATNDGKLFTRVTAADGSPRFVWLLVYVQGQVLAKANPHTSELLASVGQLLGEIDTVLAGFDHPAAHRELQWDSARAAWIADSLNVIENESRRTLLKKFLALYQAEVVPALPHLRRTVIYGDANDHNVLVSDPWPQARRAKAVIDFGDMHHTITVSEPAIAAAYAILGKSDPLPAAQAVISGYHRAYPLQESEIKIIFPVIAMRLAVSVVLSAQRKKIRPDDPYVSVSEASAWQALERLDKINPRHAHYAFRDVCNLPPDPKSQVVAAFLQNVSSTASAILDIAPRKSRAHVFDLSVSSLFLGADPRSAECAALTAAIDAELQRANKALGIGRYNEARLLYTTPLFTASDSPTDEHRTIHLGIDIFVPPGAAVHAPLAATVEAFANNIQPLDYGPVVILKHATNTGEAFYTLYGHLSVESLKTSRSASK